MTPAVGKSGAGTISISSSMVISGFFSRSYVSGGAGYITPRVGIDAGIRKQIDKGDEVLVELGLRLFIPN